MKEADYQEIVSGYDEPTCWWATRPVVIRQLYELGVLEHWLPALVPSGPGFSCV